MKSKERESLIKQFRRKRVWKILYSHHHGEIGMEGNLTYKEVKAKEENLYANPKWLDWVEILIQIEDLYTPLIKS
jgi:hypothetical protein